MKTIQLQDWKRGMSAYIWAETGEGNLYKIDYIRQDYWVVTGYCSWCCHAGTLVYVIDNPQEVARVELDLQRNLAERRQRWEREASERREQWKREEAERIAARA